MEHIVTIGLFSLLMDYKILNLNKNFKENPCTWFERCNLIYLLFLARHKVLKKKKKRQIAFIWAKQRKKSRTKIVKRVRLTFESSKHSLTYLKYCVHKITFCEDYQKIKLLNLRLRNLQNICLKNISEIW